jgi:hypothetical protein
MRFLGARERAGLRRGLDMRCVRRGAGDVLWALREYGSLLGHLNDLKNFEWLS